MNLNILDNLINVSILIYLMKNIVWFFEFFVGNLRLDCVFVVYLVIFVLKN